MAFCFTGFSDTTLASFAEHYEVELLEDGRCRLRWKMAMEMRGISRWIVRLFSPLGGLALGFLLRRFAALVEGRP